MLGFIDLCLEFSFNLFENLHQSLVLQRSLLYDIELGLRIWDVFHLSYSKRIHQIDSVVIHRHNLRCYITCLLGDHAKVKLFSMVIVEMIVDLFN